MFKNQKNTKNIKRLPRCGRMYDQFCSRLTEKDPKRVFTMQARQPMGIVANLRNSPMTKEECQVVLDEVRKREEEATAPPPPSTTDVALGAAVGELVDADDVSATQYCLNSGFSSKSGDGLPLCRCVPGFSGARYACLMMESPLLQTVQNFL